MELFRPVVELRRGRHTHDSVAQAGSLLDTPEAAVDTSNYDPNFRGISVLSPASCLRAKKYSRRHLVSTGVSECRTRRYANPFLSCKIFFFVFSVFNFLRSFLVKQLEKELLPSWTIY